MWIIAQLEIYNFKTFEKGRFTYSQNMERKDIEYEPPHTNS